MSNNDDNDKIKFRRSHPKICQPCNEGDHGGCIWPEVWTEENGGAVDILDFVSLNVWSYCQCAAQGEDAHWKAYEERKLREYDEQFPAPEPIAVEPEEGQPEAKPRAAESWELLVTFFPSDLRRPGFFDAAMDAITIEMFEGRMGKVFGDIGIVGHFNREIVLEVDPHDPYQPGGPINDLFTLEDFHKYASMAIGLLDIECRVEARRVWNVNRPVELGTSGEEEQDETDDEPMTNTDEGQ
jgi:hypothetical protein